MLILLDLSAAFDTLDIDTLIRRLQWTFGIDGSALDWIRSYLTDRSQFVRVGESKSGKVACEFGVPQGSVLGPILFTLYVAPVANVITSYGVCHLQYADDTQLYIALKNEDSISKLQNFANDVYNWFAQNEQSLNPEKSEAILLGTGARLRHEQPISSISIAGSDVDIRDSVKSLGVTIDSGLTFNEHHGTCQLHMQDIGVSHQVASTFVTSGSSSTTMRPCPLLPLWSGHVSTIATVCCTVHRNATSTNFSVFSTLLLVQSPALVYPNT